MLPRVEEIIQLVERNAKEEFLIAYGKTERVRARLAIDDLRNNFEIFGKLVYLILVQVGKGSRATSTPTRTATGTDSDGGERNYGTRSQIQFTAGLRPERDPRAPVRGQL